MYFNNDLLINVCTNEQVSLPSLEKSCQDYISNPTKERIKLKELPVDTVVKSIGISQEPTRKHTVDNVVKPGKLLLFYQHCNISFINMDLIYMHFHAFFNSAKIAR